MPKIIGETLFPKEKTGNTNNKRIKILNKKK